MLKRSLLFGILAGMTVMANAETSYTSGQLLVKVKPNQTTAARKAYKAMGATVIRSIPQIGWETIRLKTGMTVQSAMNKLTTSKAIAMTEGNPIYRPLELPNDPMVPLQYSLTKMQLSNAWTLAKGDRSVVVAIIDTGVDVNHPDLKDACLPGFDFADNDTNVVGTNPHGTHCAGIAAAIGNNGIGVAGIAYGAAILPIKVFSDGAGGAAGDVIDQGVVYAADQGASVISMSYGSEGFSQAALDALEYAYSKNVVLVGGAGNNNSSTKFYPAAYEHVIAVGATDSNDVRADFSNFGADWVDVAAPGVNIRSTVNGGGYEDFSGTSMACPNVAGLATLIVSRAGVGTLTNERVREIIETTCDPVATWTTHGRVNAFSAVSEVGTPVTDTPLPTTPLPFEGTVTVSSGALNSTDGISATIRSSVRKGVGMTGSAMTDFGLTAMTADEVSKATMTLKVSADAVATVQVFFQDLSGKWVLFTTQPGSPAGKTTTYKLTKATLAKYMQNEKINVMVRSLVPTRLMSRAKGVTNVDLLSFTFSGTRLVINNNP